MIARHVIRSSVWFLMLTIACRQPPPPPPTINHGHFESLYRAGKSVQSATGVGLSYQKLSELLQTLALELSIANDRAQTEPERQLVQVYTAALTAYQDSAAVWKIRIADGRNIGPFGNPTLPGLVEKYHLELYDNGLLDGDKAVQTIWTVASAKIDDGSRIYTSADR